MRYRSTANETATAGVSTCSRGMVLRGRTRGLALLAALLLGPVVSRADPDIWIRVAQESAPGADDFDSGALGHVRAFATWRDAAGFYFDGGPPGNYAAPVPALAAGESRLFVVDAADGLSLFLVHGVDGIPSANGGSTAMRVALAGDPDGAVRVVRDGEGDTYTPGDDGPASVFTSAHAWTQGNSDGEAFSGLDGAWAATVEFTAPPVGVGAWRAASPGGAVLDLALVPGRRVRLDRHVPEGITPCSSEPRSARFDGRARLSFEAEPSWDASVAMTAEAWVYREDASRCETIVSKDFVTSFWLGFCGGRLRFYRSGATAADADRGVAARQWTHVAASYDGATVRFFIDGEPAGVRALSNDGAGFDTPLHIGASPSAAGDFAFLGSIDEVRLWSRALERDEIAWGSSREVRDAEGLVAAFPVGVFADDVSGAAGSTSGAVETGRWGMMPPCLRVPKNPVQPSFDGLVDTTTEYAGAEEVPIRYRDGARSPDATAYLVYSEQPGAFNDFLWVGVTGLRDTEAFDGWPLEFSSVNLYLDRDTRAHGVPRPSDVTVIRSFNGFQPTRWWVGNGALYEECEPCVPVASRWGADFDFPDEFDRIPTFEFRVELGLLGPRDVPDGFAITHIGPDDFPSAPAGASPFVPRSWGCLSLGGSTGAEVATFRLRGKVRRSGEDHPGHDVYLFEGAVLRATATTESNGGFSFFEPVTPGRDLTVQVEQCAECDFRRDALAVGPIAPLFVTPVQVRYPGCDAGECDYGEVYFDFSDEASPEVQVVGFEINQATQKEVFFPDGPGTVQGISPLVPLVPGKPALVRCYVGQVGGAGEAFSAPLSIVVTRRDGTSFSRSIQPNVEGGRAALLQAAPAPADRDRWIAARRPALQQSLNYVLSAEDLDDARLLDLTLGVVPRLTGRLQLRLSRPVTLAMSYVRIHDGTATPSDAQIDAMHDYLRAALPITNVVETRRRTLFRPPAEYWFLSYCDSVLLDSWLLFDVESPVSAARMGTRGGEPTFRVTMSVVPDIPGNTSGCAYVGDPDDDGDRDGSVAVSEPSGSTATHEVGHVVGLLHTSNGHGEADGGDWEVWPYPHGTIGTPRFGNLGVILSTREDGTWDVDVVDPCPVPTVGERYPVCTETGSGLPHDIMSYGAASDLGPLGTGRWMSDISYERYYNAIAHRIIAPSIREGRALPPRAAGDGGGAGALPETIDAWSFAAAVDGDTVLPLPLLRQPVPPSELGSASGGDYRVTIRSGGGGVLASAALAPVRAQDGSAFEVLRGRMPYADGAASLIVERGAAVLASMSASPAPPAVVVLAPLSGEHLESGEHEVRWRATDADGDALVSLVQYSPDGGARWQTIGSASGAGELALPLRVEELRPGRGAVVRVTTSDGLNTTVAVSETFSVGPDETIVDVSSAELAPCGDAALVHVRLDSTELVTGLRVALEWGSGAIDSVDVRLGPDVPPDFVDDLSTEFAADGSGAVVSLALTEEVAFAPSFVFRVLELELRPAADLDAGDFFRVCAVPSLDDPAIDPAADTAVFVVRDVGLVELAPLVGCGSVELRDDAPPSLLCPGPLEVEAAPGAGGAVVEWTLGVGDDCSMESDGSLVVSCEPPSGSFLPLGVTDVVCTAVDVAGNVSRCSFSVIVRETGERISLRRGDSNTDGQVDISDASFTLNFLFRGSAASTCPDASDINDDGSVDISDASFTLNFLFRGGPEPPAPGQRRCDVDPTADGLAPCEYDSCP